MTILHLKKSINRSVPRLALLLIPLVVTCFAPLRRAQGVVPPPDGGYPGFTTAEGTKALFSLTTGVAALLLNTTGGFNTALGTASLVYNDTGSYNTAIGDRALFNNTTGDHNTAVGTAGLGGGPALFNNTIGRFNT